MPNRLRSSALVSIILQLFLCGSALAEEHLLLPDDPGPKKVEDPRKGKGGAPAKTLEVSDYVLQFYDPAGKQDFDPDTFTNWAKKNPNSLADLKELLKKDYPRHAGPIDLEAISDPQNKKAVLLVARDPANRGAKLGEHKVFHGQAFGLRGTGYVIIGPVREVEDPRKKK